ncbi:MAG: hypothetical protein EHM28_06380 [Spirochaetaceae bacterium]|nr:MAG: hypothetical protein EHM28_06380 [Spirochaetaceae bacterium]
MKKLETKYIRTGLFGILIIFFFLPFLVVSCPNHGSREINGVQVAFGYSVSGGSLSTVTDNQYFPPAIPGIIAMIAALAGVIFSFFKKQISFILCIIAAVVGFSSMFLLKLNIDAEAAKKAGDGLIVRYAYGYWLALGGFIIVLLLIILLYFADGLKMQFKMPFKLPIKLKRHSSPGKVTRSRRTRRRR